MESKGAIEAVTTRRVEGWLFLIASRRLRGQYPRKRYFVLEGCLALCYKNQPSSPDEVPIRKGVIDPYTRVADNGRESIHGKVLFVFTLYDAYDSQNELKFGVRNGEEAAKWMDAFKDATHQAVPRSTSGAVPTTVGKRRTPFRKRGGSLYRQSSGGSQEVFPTDDDRHPVPGIPDWAGGLTAKDGSPDVIAASPWRIIGCKNGLRFFQENTDKGGLRHMLSDEQPALMAVGVVNAPCEAIFETVMALGPSRSEWDFCFSRGRLLEHIDGHTDIVYKLLNNRWLPWRLRPRDLVLLRYWRREDDGSYVILYRSVKHEKCPRRRGFVRASLKKKAGGGFVISPLGSCGCTYKRSLVKHMITADWKMWQASIWPKYAQHVTTRFLERVAAIREVYRARPFGSSLVPAQLGSSLQNGIRNVDENVNRHVADDDHAAKQGTLDSPKSEKTASDEDSPFLHMVENDEFYDVSDELSWTEDSFDAHFATEVEGTSDENEEQKNQGTQKMSAAAAIVRRLHDLTSSAQKKHDLGSITGEDLSASFCKVGTLPRSTDCTIGSSWNNAEAGTFLIRGKKYLTNQKKVKAEEPWMQFVAADWIKSNKREDHLACRPANPLQLLSFELQRKAHGREKPPFFLIINFQVPGATSYSLALYYMTIKSLGDDPLFAKFVAGDDTYRNRRFKLIPYIAQGSWIVKQSVGRKALLLGQALDITYHRGENYLEMDVDIGSSSVARGVVNLVLGYLSKLVIEMAFLIQANTEEELPEHLLGTCRLDYLDVNKAFSGTST